MNLKEKNIIDLLIVDDDSDLRQLLTVLFEQNGYKSLAVSGGSEFKALYQKNTFRLIIMDIQMPNESGFDLLKWTRTQPHVTPMLMLSAQNTIDYKVEGLELGAEDYLVKPFEPKELLARVAVILRRENQEEVTSDLNFGGFTYQHATKTLYYDNQIVDLTTGEEEVLALFCEHPNKTLSREFIFAQIKNYEFDPFDRTIDIRITRLRKKLAKYANADNLLKTIRGKGYQLIC